MSRYIDKETLMELLDSNDLSEAQKIQLARAYTAQQRKANYAEGAGLVVSVWKTLVGQVINHRVLQTIFSSPLLRVQH
jgi:hypothetical protein